MAHELAESLQPPKLVVRQFDLVEDDNARAQTPSYSLATACCPILGSVRRAGSGRHFSGETCRWKRSQFATVVMLTIEVILSRKTVPARWSSSCWTTRAT